MTGPVVAPLAKVPVGFQLRAPPGEIVTGPERVKEVFGLPEAKALTCMVPVKVPPPGPETLTLLKDTVKVPPPTLGQIAVEAVAARVKRAV